MTSEQEAQLNKALADMKAAAYRDGWRDAMKALRKAALEVSSRCPILELPDDKGFAGLPDHLQPRTVAPFTTGGTLQYDPWAVIQMANLSIGLTPYLPE